MIKLIGAILILLTAMLFGYSFVYHFQEQLLILQEFIWSLDYIYFELHTNMVSIPELLKELSKKNIPRLNSVFEEMHNGVLQYGAAYFPSCWQEGVIQYRGFLSEQNYLALLGLSDILGQYILEDQLLAIEKIISDLKREYNHNKTQLYKTWKIYMGIASACGAMIVIVLI